MNKNNEPQTSREYNENEKFYGAMPKNKTREI